MTCVRATNPFSAPSPRAVFHQSQSGSTRLFKTARKLEVSSTEEQLDRAGPKMGPLEDLYDQAQRRLEEFMDES